MDPSRLLPAARPRSPRKFHHEVFRANPAFQNAMSYLGGDGRSWSWGHLSVGAKRRSHGCSPLGAVVPVGVVLNEGVPGLCLSRAVGTPNHGATDRACGMVDAELGGELLGDLVLALLGMVRRDASKEGDVDSGNAGTTNLAAGRPVSPEQLEPLTMPGDHGLRHNDDERAGPAGPERRRTTQKIRSWPRSRTRF